MATARTVVVIVPRPRIMCVPVIVVERRVLVAGLATVGLGTCHARLLSRAVWCR